MRGSSLLAALALLCAAPATSTATFAQSPPPGATACTGCHAGSDSALPSLKGRAAADIEAAMIAFKTGAREATLMDRIARGFSEAEIKAMSQWLANGGAK